MNTFLDFKPKLNLIHLPVQSKKSGKNTYVVTEPFICQFKESTPFTEELGNCFLYVPKGYITDFSSLPKIIRWLVPPLGKYGHALLVYDKLEKDGVMYGTRHDVKSITKDEISDLVKDSLPLSSKTSNEEKFNEAMKILGVGYFRRLLTYRIAYFIDMCSR